MYQSIDAMDKISTIKEKISRQCGQPHHLYLDYVKNIKYLEDDKRLIDYNIRGLLSFGLLMRQNQIKVIVKTPTGKTFAIECDVGELLEGFRDKIMQVTGIPLDQINRVFDGRKLSNGGKTLQHYGIEEDSVIELFMIIRRD